MKELLRAETKWNSGRVYCHPSFQGGARARGAAAEDEGAGGEVGRRQDGPAHRGARQEVGT